MNNITIGIPRSLFYYYYGTLWKYFFKELNVNTILSPKTTPIIMKLGTDLANDEMCLSFKNYLGHIKYLEDKCDYILVPRIDNYSINDQTCTNFLAAFDIVSNFIKTPILNYNISFTNHETEEFAFYVIGSALGFSKSNIMRAYYKAKEFEKEEKRAKERLNERKLKSNKKKILVVGHPYNLYDGMIGEPIIKFLVKADVEVLYSDAFPESLTSKLSKHLSNTLYFKYSKENIGAIELVKNYIDGVVFLTTFPCGLDSLVNELVMRRISLPYLNLVIDDMTGTGGIETRLESFLDILEERSMKHE